MIESIKHLLINALPYEINSLYRFTDETFFGHLWAVDKFIPFIFIICYSGCAKTKHSSYTEIEPKFLNLTILEEDATKKWTDV